MRKPIPIPRMRREVALSDLELDVQRLLLRYYELAQPTRISFFLYNVMNHARATGKLLPRPSSERKLDTRTIRFDLTCAAFPEQYDAYLGEERVGYLRLRHGEFRVHGGNSGGPCIYQAAPHGAGSFDQDERDYHLRWAAFKILEWIDKGRPMQFQADDPPPAPMINYETTGGKPGMDCDEVDE